MADLMTQDFSLPEEDSSQLSDFVPKELPKEGSSLKPAAPEKQPVFNLNKWVNSPDIQTAMPGMKYNRTLPDGSIELITESRDINANGKTAVVKPKDLIGSVLKNSGLDLNKVKFEVNTPETADALSPASWEDRAKLKAGNPRGNLEYFKNKFEDARYTPENGIVVKDKDNVWKQVDPSFLGTGTPWEKTKELMKDLTADMAIPIAEGLAQTAGSALGIYGGGAAAGPVGSMAGNLWGAMAAGAGASKLKYTFGKLWGTYHPDSPEEELHDVATDTFMAGAMAAIAPGIAPAAKGLSKAFGFLKDNLQNQTKDAMATIWAQAINEPKVAIRGAMDNPEAPKIAAKMVRDFGPTADPEVIKAAAGAKAESLIKSAMPDIEAGVQRTWTKNLGNLIESTNQNFKANVENMFSHPLEQATKEGYLIPEYEGKQLVGFRPLTERTAREMASNPNMPAPANFSPDTEKGLQELTKQLNKTLSRWQEAPTFEGRAGAKKALDFSRTMAETLDSIAEKYGDTSPVSRIAKNLKSSMKQEIGQSFTDAGAGEAYSNLNASYSSAIDGVKILRKAVYAQAADKPEAMRKLVEKIASSPSSSTGLKTELSGISEFYPQAEEMFQNVKNNEWAKSFVGMSGRLEHAASLANLSRTAISLPAKMVPGLIPSNPRNIGTWIRGSNAIDSATTKGIQYLDQLNSFFKDMTPAQLKEFYTNEPVATGTFQGLMHVFGAEDQLKSGLIQKGVQGGNQ